MDYFINDTQEKIEEAERRLALSTDRLEKIKLMQRIDDLTKLKEIFIDLKKDPYLSPEIEPIK